MPYDVLSTLPSAFKNCEDVPPDLTKVVAFKVPMIVAALPEPLVLFMYKPSPLPPFVIFKAIPLPLECVMPTVSLLPELEKVPLAAIKVCVPKSKLAVAPV